MKEKLTLNKKNQLQYRKIDYEVKFTIKWINQLLYEFKIID